MRIRSFILLLTIATLFACDKSKNITKTSVDIDRSQAPKPGPAPKISIGDYRKFTLENGLKVIVVENHRTPEVSYQLDLAIDPIMEGKKAGISSLAGSLLKSGTTTRNKSEIDEEIDFVGGRISTTATGIYATSLKKHSTVILSIMSDILLHPTYPEEELQKEKTLTISGLAADETNPSSISYQVSNIINYGENHPYGEYETKESISNITREDLVNYYETFFRPNVGYLIIVGDITEEEARVNAEKYFGKWQFQEVPKYTYDLPQPPATNRVIVVPMDDAVQSIINITYPINIKPGGENNVAATLMNKILGGHGFSSRLMQNIREDKGYTYAAYSSLTKDQLIGEFSASASVRNEVTDSAVVQFLSEMEYMTSNLTPDSTLQLMKNNSLGKIALSLEDPETVAEFALNIEKYNLPTNFYDTYLTQLEGLTKEDILQAAKKYILPMNSNIIVTGNVDEIADKLKAFSADGKIEILDHHGKLWEGMKKIPQGVTIESIFEKYINAIGGKEKLESITNYRQTGKITVQGMEMDMTVIMKDNDKLELNISMGTNSIMKQIINGNKGIQIQQGQTTTIENKELIISRVNMNLMSCMYLSNYGLKANLLGIKDFEDEPCYVVELSDSTEVYSTEYYSISTGLKMGSKGEFETPAGSLVVISVFKNHKDYNGIILPAISEQKMGTQTMIFSINKMDVNISISDEIFTLD